MKERGILQHPTKRGWFTVRLANVDPRKAPLRIEQPGPITAARGYRIRLQAAVIEARRGNPEQLEKLLNGTRSTMVKRPETPREILFDEILEDRLLELRRRCGAKDKYATHKECVKALWRLNEYTYAIHLRKPMFLEWFGSRLASSITPAEITEKLEGLKNDHGGKALPATYMHYRTNLCGVFKTARINKKLLASPMPDVPCKTFDNARVRFLDQQDPATQEEENKIRAVIRERWPRREAELDLLLTTAMRKGEAWKLRKSDVFLHAKPAPYIWLRQRKNKMQGHVPLIPEAVDAVKLLLSYSKGEEFLIPTPDDPRGRDDLTKRPKCYSMWWFKEACRIAGVRDFHPHDLRHTAASRMTIDGVDRRIIQELLGHKTAKMTDRYSHLSNSSLVAGVNSLSHWKPRPGLTMVEKEEKKA